MHGRLPSRDVQLSSAIPGDLSVNHTSLSARSLTEQMFSNPPQDDKIRQLGKLRSPAERFTFGSSIEACHRL